MTRSFLGRGIIAAAIAMAIAASIVSCTDPIGGSAAVPQVTSFSLERSRNAALAADYSGTIDQTTKTIEIALPDSLTARSGLKASIGLSSGATLLGGEERDFSVSPLSIAITTADGVTASYLVKINRIYPDLSADQKKALVFSEYYSGSPYSMKGSNNQYLELTNRSASTIDLSGYQLVRSVWENGRRREDKDVKVSLKGTLGAGKAVVLHSHRLSTSFSDFLKLGPDKRQTDFYYNEFITFSGIDGVKLVYKGETLDVLGPQGGNGNGLDWGNQKLMVRKAGKLPSTTWTENEWITWVSTNGATDAANAGLASAAVPVTNANLTYFAFEGLAKRAYGIINESPTPGVEVTVHEAEGKLLSPTVSTDGRTVRFKGADIISGQTKIDFSQPVTLTVIASDGITAKNYPVTFTTYRDVEYTTVNYDFDGGITSLLASIKGKIDDQAFSGTYVEGVVTARDIYFDKDSQYSFFIQDRNAGLMVASNAPIDSSIMVGHRVRVEVTTAKEFFQMPEVSGFGAITRVSPNQQKIYYETDSYDNFGCLGKVYRYKGTIAAEMNQYLAGVFVDTLAFHGTSKMRSLLGQDAFVEAYGPVSYAYKTFRMELNQSHQVKKP